ncbi:hypothetical protein IQ06DRAFT_25091 [Phaeosphaeriaceae sp. SRC1lsM3a]|nr:hypothetical protein IQ06DRAFT_25091 [Stagonospora sp. SRC1lsM3a]
MTGDGQESWVYRMVSDVRRTFQTHATPDNTPSNQTGGVDDAMHSLNDALEDLGKLRIRTDACKVDLNLSVSEARLCVDSFIDVLVNMVVPDVFASSIDLELLRLLPEIINSPYINIDPGMYVMYYNALYYGLNDLRGPGDPVAQGMYLKILEAVPAWLDTAGDSDMDGHTAALTAWTATNNHDYQLSWKFHLKSCHYVKMKKIDQIDAIPASTFEEEDKKENDRYLYWHVLSTDQLFRTFYGKPTVMRWVSSRVRPPSIVRPNFMHPSVSQVMLAVVWLRYTVLTAEILNEIDDPANPPQQHNLTRKLDDYCNSLQELMEEWKLESIMQTDPSEALRYLIADHVMTIYSFIIGVRRLVKRSADSPRVDMVTLGAARKVVRYAIEFTIEDMPTKKAQSVCLHFISFYPFCAVFSLYEHILLCTNPEDCKEDIQLLESVGAAMTEASKTRADLAPFAKTINALNKVSRSFYDERHRPMMTSGSPASPTAANMPELDMSAFASFPDLPFNFEDNSQPLGFFRAMENDLTARNWHEGWWDVGPGLEDPMMGISGR